MRTMFATINTELKISVSYSVPTYQHYKKGILHSFTVYMQIMFSLFSSTTEIQQCQLDDAITTCT